MKKCLYLLLVLFSITSASAEYTKYHVSIEVELNNGKTLKAYSTIHPEPEKDSINNIDYTTRFLSNILDLGTDTIYVHRNRIAYKYFYMPGQPAAVIYSLIDPVKILKKDVKSIKLLDHFIFGYSCWIQNELVIKDTNWMKSPVVEKLEYAGYLCDFQIFVHQKSPVINEMDAALKAEIKKYEKENTDPGKNISDRKLEQIIEKYLRKKIKVIVVECCSC